MTFELETTTKAKLTDVVVLSQKNRQPDENPGAKLSFETSLSNHMLAQPGTRTARGRDKTREALAKGVVS